MSEQSQFLFISHNKITMEIANQLLGITMQEPGFRASWQWTSKRP
jgi:chromosome segregation protein